MKLNLGSRDRNMEGFKNMDIEKHPGVDYVGDVSDLSRFKDGSIEEIYASNILEHFPAVRTVEVLKEWNRVLEDDGRLLISVPDFKRCAELYLEYGLQDWIVNMLWGDQEYETAFHYTGFDHNRMLRLLAQANFKTATRVISFGVEDCSSLVCSKDKKPVCLNMVATK